ncbi:MAG: 6-phosphofructokinase [Defluviitaleaceae bacterium]|nr:6-phosphofructokinase [Defluviitaleaceae bacterium]
MKKIAILTSGGDAPGMNSVIRAVVRSAVKENLQVTGIRRGYEGLISGDIEEMRADSVSDISDHGGTMLLSARCEEMRTEQGLKRAYEMAKIFSFDALVVVGGDGSFTGAKKLSELGLNVIGIPGTIDLDMPYTEYTVGFDTAVNTGMEAISKIRDTTFSHERVSIVEVMGRNCGAIAMWCAVASGADEVLVPEVRDKKPEDVIKQILTNRAKGKKHNLIVVAEGIGKSQELASKIEEITGISSRATILGHLQRGGAPSAVDRIHGSAMGNFAVEILIAGEKNRAIMVKDGKYGHMDIEQALEQTPVFDQSMYNRVRNLSLTG